jgi:glyoxylase-like metal-dependent hydrolase (beta-lactamase superfamily II)
VSRTAFLRLFIAVFVLQVAWTLSSQTEKPPGPLRTAPVTENLHLIQGEGGNVAMLVTGEGVVVVDNMFHRNHADILAQIAMTTDQPLRYVINTHQHDDHAGGNVRMLPLAEVIAHRNVRANLSDIKQPYYEDTPDTPIGLPRVTFDSTMAVHPGGTEVSAHYFGRAHTSGDVVVQFPSLGVIHTGDLFIAQRGGRVVDPGDSRPRGVNIYVDYAQGGSFIEWSQVFEGLLALEFDTVIPGHGPVTTRAEIVQFKADLEAMRGRLTGLIRGGASRADVAKTLEDDYGWRSTGCPESPPTPGCLQYQQLDSLIAELKG